MTRLDPLVALTATARSLWAGNRRIPSQLAFIAGASLLTRAFRGRHSVPGRFGLAAAGLSLICSQLGRGRSAGSADEREDYGRGSRRRDQFNRCRSNSDGEPASLQPWLRRSPPRVARR